MLWNNEIILEITKGNSNNIGFEANGICINTRNIKSGDVFVAIEGGEKYLDNAFFNGAVAAIVPENSDINIKDKPIIKVKDTFQALVDLGQYKRNNNAKYIAITGSVGKTGTKDMLAKVLSAYGETYATSGNYNNHYGVPLTLANMPETTEFAVIELGMNHSGEISDLVKQVRPNVALITTIAECHTEFFNSTEDIAYAKSEIFENINGIAVINKESPCFDITQSEAKKHTDNIITFGKNADVSLNKCECFADSSDVKIDDYSFNLPIPGEHIALNTCGVFAVLKSLNLDFDKAINVIENISATEGRGKRINVSLKDKNITIIDETYNASPRAMIASIKTFSLIEDGRKILALGDMLELGINSKELHMSILPSILESNIDKVYCCGEFTKFVYDKLPENLKGAYAENSEKLVPFIEKDLQDSDNLLTKGSHGSRMDFIVNYFKGK